MYSERLLERVIKAGDPFNEPENELLVLNRSITRYLSLLLNSQQGTAQTVIDFGMPDLNTIRFSDDLEGLRDLEETIEAQILKYEPRMHSVKVTTMANETERLSLMFKISASIKYNNEVMGLVFETILGADGNIIVNRV
ncbi:type VI secretion system baseplate subunit TssE [Shewanella surugensis]|uniref:Type VI secretion system baseplate subunit TssE n=1 Tax=Shewanella surugensis TaxID=212020 RepID=A0ABT0L706_9GAMM|nr:type VI secretion system baseplate subunit TssE [Shewanella surugensis]MCL1123468.1 type VI secretion system baseplate subunit TssE [Shewanella surugensis]